jgi:hypothetical protein
MGMTRKNIRNMETLETEIQNLRKKTAGLEEELEHNMNHLRNHFPGMVLHSVLPPEITRYKSISASLLDLFLQHQRLRESISGLAGSLIDKLADGLSWVINRYFTAKK